MDKPQSAIVHEVTPSNFVQGLDLDVLSSQNDSVIDLFSTNYPSEKCKVIGSALRRINKVRNKMASAVAAVGVASN